MMQLVKNVFFICGAYSRKVAEAVLATVEQLNKDEI